MNELFDPALPRPYCAERLPVTNVPRSPMGKVLKARLKEIARQRLSGATAAGKPGPGPDA